MTAVECIQVTRRFESSKVVLDRISFEIEPGEFFVLLGPSGSGKSTLLRLIAGLDQPDQGDIRFDGRSILSLPPEQRDVGMVFQNYALYPHLTVKANLAFPLKVRKVPAAEVQRRIAEIARILQIDHLLDRKPAALSGGQQQRVALGRALIRRPKVLLLDEPLSNLDAQLRQQMRSQLLQMHRTILRTTTIYVTHDQIEALTMGDRIAVLHQGQLQQVGTPEDVYNRPANQFVAQFIGTPPMNLFAGSLLIRDGTPYFISDPAGVRLSLESWRSEIPVAEGMGALGVRPEHLQLTQENPLFHIVVDFVENVGAEFLCLFTSDLGRGYVRSPRRVAIGTAIGVTLSSHALLHWFDAAGNRVTSWVRK